MSDIKRRSKRLKAEFTFKHWREQGENETLAFCGCHLTHIQQKECLMKVKPITLANGDQ